MLSKVISIPYIENTNKASKTKKNNSLISILSI